MQIDARTAALEALLQVKDNEGYSNIVIDKTLRKYEMDKRDSALANIIFYGVLERKITLDYIISRFLTKKSMKLSSACELILESAVYQIMYLDKVPDSAAVNEAVNLAKKHKCPHSFVNGVLRSIIREKEKLTLPSGTDAKSLSIKYSIPEDLISMWQSSYGEEVTAKLLESFTEKSRVYLRVNNTRNTTADFLRSFEGSDVNVETYPHHDNTCIIRSSGDITKLPQFEEGLFHVQDLSSQYLCDIVNPQENETVVDVCAAPGGKTFTMAEKMNGTGTVYSYDLYKGRVKLIFTGAKRLGLENVRAFVRDAATADTHGILADRVLCDVPCSGYGTIRKKPEIRYKALDTVSDLPEIQYRILCNSKEFVKPGGLLVYSTCTLNPEENNLIAAKFLRENPDFVSEPVKLKVNRAVKENDYELTMMPYLTGTDGFFAASFRRIK
ncbi:MAG: 16S rRNA (cytosine(967)-C(5))-methyltransferase RsmB [Clostridia bacterium]|nr:16S rRNA (cytosine(967)-C(5))-methyltransferase RsmB [Clostridia bacterium]